MPTKEERRKLKKEYGDLLERVSKVLFEEDPVGLDFGDNVDEYDTEASTILPRLRNCHSAADTRNVIYQEFCRWFDAQNILVLRKEFGSCGKKVAQDNHPLQTTNRRERRLSFALGA